MKRIEKIDLQVELVTLKITIERSSFHQSDIGYELSLAVVKVPPVADRECMVNGDVKSLNVSIN